ncbi:Imm42 family immunity protein [Methylovulum psychrotolerans]|nr:Imm42 family immunity protein [Methylovulum psychrotolerans]
MLIGNPLSFAIECYHEPLNTRHVFGRMCLWVAGNRLGDITEPDCMLNPTAANLSRLLERLSTLNDPALLQLSDREAFDFLNQVLYLDDDRTNDEIQQDAERYCKFHFLTLGGESFERTKSFIVLVGEEVALLFTDNVDIFHSAHLPKSEFIDVVEQFYSWFKNEELSRFAKCGGTRIDKL